MTWQGVAGLGKAGLGLAWLGSARLGVAWLGESGQGKARHYQWGFQMDAFEITIETLVSAGVIATAIVGFGICLEVLTNDDD